MQLEEYSKREYIAKVCHQVNKAYCESIGDFSQVNWEDASEWQKESARNGVCFHLANPQAKANASHENWQKKKEEAGWIYGPFKDVQNKLHPCMIPFNQLPEKQQTKDFIFKAIVNALDKGDQIK